METILEEFFKFRGIRELEKETKRSAPMVTTRLAKVCQLLNRYHVRYVVVGGEACILHGLTRTTEDIDVFIDREVKNVEKTLDALGKLPLGIAKEIPLEKVVKDPITIIGDQPRVDILTALSGISFSDAWRSRRLTKVNGVRVPYIALSLLIKSKDTDRLQDLADKEGLEKLKRLRYG